MSHPELPFGLTIEEIPEYRGGGFMIRESYGISLIGEGVTYRDIDLRVEKLHGYGVKQNMLAAEVTDKDGNIHFITVQPHPDPKVKYPFLVQFSEKSATRDNADYEWIDLRND